MVGQGVCRKRAIGSDESRERGYPRKRAKLLSTANSEPPRRPEPVRRLQNRASGENPLPKNARHEMLVRDWKGSDVRKGVCS